jgi:hypothetical protein
MLYITEVFSKVVSPGPTQTVVTSDTNVQIHVATTHNWYEFRPLWHYEFVAYSDQVKI